MLGALCAVCPDGPSINASIDGFGIVSLKLDGLLELHRPKQGSGVEAGAQRDVVEVGMVRHLHEGRAEGASCKARAGFMQDPAAGVDQEDGSCGVSHAKGRDFASAVDGVDQEALGGG